MEKNQTSSFGALARFPAGTSSSQQQRVDNREGVETQNPPHPSEHVRTHENTSAPVPTGADVFGQWLTVQEAVAYCQFKGLPRTQKTIRKWASRAAMAPAGSAEIIVQRQDTENGFRWAIDRASLDLKIDQERDFEARAKEQQIDAHLSAPVPTGTHTSEPLRVVNASHLEMRTDENPSAPVRTHENTSAPVHTGADIKNDPMVEFLMKQIDIKDQQLAVKDRQIESMLERDQETNILIQGLHQNLSGMMQALPGVRKQEQEIPYTDELSRGDNSPPHNS